MTKNEREEIMKCAGILDGMATMLSTEDDGELIIDKLNEVAYKLEAIVKGWDQFNISDYRLPIDSGRDKWKGGDADDV